MNPMVMADSSSSKLDRALAWVCRACPVCRRARGRQAGVAFWLVTRVERQLCPFCRAYERVYGRKAHEGQRASAPSTVL